MKILGIEVDKSNFYKVRCLDLIDTEVILATEELSKDAKTKKQLLLKGKRLMLYYNRIISLLEFSMKLGFIDYGEVSTIKHRLRKLKEVAERLTIDLY